MQGISENASSLAQTFPYEGNLSLDVKDPVVLASSFMLYKIGKLVLNVVVDLQ